MSEAFESVCSLTPVTSSVSAASGRSKRSLQVVCATYWRNPTGSFEDDMYNPSSGASFAARSCELFFWFEVLLVFVTAVATMVVIYAFWLTPFQCTSSEVSTGCQLCKNWSTCTSCVPGFVLHRNLPDETTYCQRNCTEQQVSANCTRCLDEHTCSECVSGYAVQELKNSTVCAADVFTLEIAQTSQEHTHRFKGDTLAEKIV